jgi:hypothetical protein
MTWGGLHHWFARPGEATAEFFVLLGAIPSGEAAQRAPPKTTGLPLAGPDQARSLRPPPSRSTACRRDPRRRRTQHPSCYLRQSPHRRQTHWRVTSNWPPTSTANFFCMGCSLALCVRQIGAVWALTLSARSSGLAVPDLQLDDSHYELNIRLYILFLDRPMRPPLWCSCRTLSQRVLLLTGTTSCRSPRTGPSDARAGSDPCRSPRHWAFWRPCWQWPVPQSLQRLFRRPYTGSGPCRSPCKSPSGARAGSSWAWAWVWASASQAPL